VTELPYHLRPGNRPLVAVTAVLVVVFTAGLLGPAANTLDDSLRAHARKRTEFERWQEDFRDYRPIDARERAQWQESFSALRAWVPVAGDEPQLVTEVARAVQTPTTKDLQVLKDDPLESGVDPLAEPLELRSPLDSASARLRGVPLTLQFRCAHADLLALLGRIQRKQIPARLDALHLRRLFTDIEVRMDLVFFVREESAP
jgi:hypothetical protein